MSDSQDTDDFALTAFELIVTAFLKVLMPPLFEMDFVFT
jgi:hypothetical protein